MPSEDNAFTQPPNEVPGGAQPDSGGAGGVKRHRLRNAILGIVLVFAAFLAVLFVGQYVVSMRAGDPFAAAAKAGIPVSYSDPFYEKWGAKRPTSPEENAAVHYEEAFSVMPRKPSLTAMPQMPIVSRAPMPDDTRAPLESGLVSTIRDYLAPHKDFLAGVRRATAVNECYFSATFAGVASNLHHLTKTREVARLLALNTVLAAEEERPSDGVDACIDGIALGRRLFKEPALLSGLVGCAIDSIILRSGAERLLSRTDPSNEDLAKLQAACLSAADELSFRTAFIGEIAMQQDFFDGLRKGESLSYLTGNTSSPGEKQSFLTKLALGFAAGYISANRRRGLGMMLEMVDAATNPTPETVAGGQWQKWTDEASKKKYVFNAMLLPALSQGLTQCELTRAKLRAAGVCCAAMRYRNDHGKWPADLDALVGKYLDKAPIDPFTGKSLIYKSDENGIMAYSVGPDQVDNGGRPYLVLKTPETPEEALRQGDDAGFRVLK